MHLFFVRHGETEHNVAGLLAGVTDSKLTNHGVLQTQRLAKHLVQERKLRFSHVFSSDLQRAFMTANEISKAQNALEEAVLKIEVIRLELIREQDFGSFELISWSARHMQDDGTNKIPKITDPGFEPKETADAMRARAEKFIDDFIIPLTALEDEIELRIAVVSHGLFLGSLWKSFLNRFQTKNVAVSSEAQATALGRPLEHLPSWSNTGYLELEVNLTSSTANLQADSIDHEQVRSNSNPMFVRSTLKIHTVNCKPHLSNLKRTRGGVGSAAFDHRQQSLEGFFKKPKA